MILKDYPYWAVSDLQGLIDQVRQICNIRKNDISQASNLDSVFMSGRRVRRVPSASNDVISGDKIDDFNVTKDYAYFLVDNAGTGEWVRVALTTW